jgi:hypothetical protein
MAEFLESVGYWIEVRWRGFLRRKNTSELYNSLLGRGVSLDNHLGWTRREVIRHPNR